MFTMGLGFALSIQNSTENKKSCTKYASLSISLILFYLLLYKNNYKSMVINIYLFYKYCIKWCVGGVSLMCGGMVKKTPDLQDAVVGSKKLK